MIILKTTQFSSVQVILDKHAQNKSRIEFNFLRISSFDLYPPPFPTDSANTMEYLLEI